MSVDEHLGRVKFGHAVSVDVKLMVVYAVIGLGDQIFLDEQNFVSGGTGSPMFADTYSYPLAFLIPALPGSCRASRVP